MTPTVAHRSLVPFVGLLALVCSLLIAAPVQAAADDALLPVVFVHGQSGSATQFQSHAMRFTSNDYPHELLHAFEYDTSRSGPEHQQQVLADLDATVDGLRDEHDTDEVNLVGHSRGTGVSLDYLEDEDQAAKVANYVNLDGSSGRSTVDTVRTLAVWGEGDEDRTIHGADREVQLADQGHTEVATSAETFAHMYELYLGQSPTTTDVLREDEVTIAGRATLFPANVGVQGADLAVYEVDPATGQRRDTGPLHQVEGLPADGSWGPLDVDPTASYELELTRDDTDLTHHFYAEPFEHSNHMVRLQTSNPDDAIALLIEDDPAHTSLVITRDMEWWGDQDTGSDALEIDGTDVINAGTSPRTDRNIAVFVFDDGSDGDSHPEQKLPIFTLPQTMFLTGIDLHIPASPDAADTVELAMTMRGEHTTTINLPNWPSDRHRVSVAFNDYLPVPAEDEDEEVPSPAPFTDITGNVHADSIRTLQERGIVKGYDGERFGPQHTLRRDQMATIIARAMQLEPATTGPFTDVTDSPHAGAINALAARGIVLGTQTEGRFGPRDEIRRDQLAALLGRALDVPLASDGPFTDVGGNTHEAWINALAADGVVEGWPDDTFRPRRAVQRDQAASMVDRALPLLDTDT